MNARNALPPTVWLLAALVLVAALPVGGDGSTGAVEEAIASPASDAESLLRLAEEWMEADGMTLVVAFRGRGTCGDGARACELLFRELARGPGEIGAALSRVQREHIRLIESGAEGRWYVNIQGRLREGTGAERLWESLDRRYGAAEGVYEDAGTRSAMYAAAPFASRVLVGDRAFTLQAAVHRDPAAGRERVTFGTPLILIEY